MHQIGIRNRNDEGSRFNVAMTMKSKSFVPIRNTSAPFLQAKQTVPP